MGCEAECSEPPRRHQPITSAHTRPSCHMSLVASLLVISCFDICSDFIHFYIFIYFHRCKNSSRLCEAEGRGQRSAPAAAAAVPRL